MCCGAWLKPGTCTHRESCACPATPVTLLPRHEAWLRAEDERVEVVCSGGRGRTGTALACLAVLDGVRAERAVAFVRERYDARGIETPWQRRFVARFLTA